MGKAPDESREPGNSKRRFLRGLLWSLGGVFLCFVIVIATLPVLKAQASSLSFQWVIFGCLAVVLVGALVVLPIVTRRR